ncbi:MAG: hypothetical protein DHS20C18_03100 [Saprospiraceae bacterium]|nr:MAG: hypothetical protein DHS20C18_03100 [Saprospiraceae bacterium]
METSNLIDDQMNLHLSEDNKSDLIATAKWAKFLSIVGFVMMGLMLLGIFAASSMMAYMLQESTGGLIGSGVIIVFYLILLGIFFFPLLFQFRFANKALVAVETGNQSALTGAFSNLKSMYKFWGIYTAIILGLYGLILVGSLLIGIGSSI